MRASRSAFLALLLFLTCLVEVRGDQSAPSTNVVVEPRPPAPLDVKRVDESEPGIPNAFRIHGTSGTNRFAFLLPAGYRMEVVRQDKVLLISPDQLGYIAIRIVDAVVRKTIPQDVLREKARLQFAQPEIVEEFRLHAADCAGPAIEFKWLGPENFPMRGRMALVPTAIGVLEFTAATPPAGIVEAHHALNTVLTTFRAAAGGELKIAPLSNLF